MQHIIDKLNELKRLDKNFKIYGADKHRYQMNPVLTEAEVATFEQKHGVTLPEDYRWFITHVGNGGAGPAKGIIPLSTEYDGIFEDFPFEKFQQFDFSKCLDTYRDYPNSMAAEYALDIVVEKVIKSAIPLSANHYDGDQWLVLTGNLKGSIWMYDYWGMSDPKYLAVFNKMQNNAMTFSEWYEYWLDESIARCQKSDQPQNYQHNPFRRGIKLEQYMVDNDEVEWRILLEEENGKHPERNK